MDNPVRKIPLPFVAGDPWAQPGAQVAPSPESVQRLRITTGAPLRYRVIGYDGVGPDAAPVDGDVSSADSVVVKILTDIRGNETLARTVTTVESGGSEVPTGKQLTEDDVSANEEVLIGFVATTQDSADAIWVFVDDGAGVA